jgi:predicted nucleic acid-binding protein
MSGEGFLLDTNVLSEFNHKQPPDPNVKQWVASTPTSSLYVSVITLSEIRFGIELLADGKRRKQLEQWLEQDLHSWFDGGRILGIDEETGILWADRSPISSTASLPRPPPSINSPSSRAT